MKKKKIERIPIVVSFAATEQIEELISKGWDFMLHYNQNQEDDKIGWEADFTRKLKKPLKGALGLWDNHECGYSPDNPSLAIFLAYSNIKAGRRLKVK